MKQSKEAELSEIKAAWVSYHHDVKMCSEAQEAQSITSFLIAIQTHTEEHGPYRYRFILNMLTQYCSEGENLVKTFETEMKDNFKLKPEGEKFKVKIIEDRSNKTIILYFKMTLAKLFDCKASDFVLVDTRKGCIELTYIITSDIAEKIQKCILSQDDEDFEHANIVELWIER